MEPRSAERGNPVVQRIKRAKDKAPSMEPRSAERGNLLDLVQQSAQVSKLQWSHAQLSVETITDMVALDEPLGLQWSHAQLSVETDALLARAARRVAGFNGATLS